MTQRIQHHSSHVGYGDLRGDSVAVRVCESAKRAGLQGIPNPVHAEGETDEERALSLLHFMSREGIADLADGMGETT